jgi:hypothetical protein
MSALGLVEGLHRTRSMIASWIALAALLAGVGLAWPTAASAHLRTGTIAVDYRASIAMPHTAAYTAEIGQGDHSLRLTRAAGHAVIVLGYLGEPMLRLDAAGVGINAASPTAVAVGLLAKARAVSAAAASWRLRAGQRSVSWLDARAQQLPVGVDSSAWAVPLIVDGHRATLRGQLRRYPAPSLLGWALLLAGLLAAGVRLVVLARREVTRAAALGAAALGAGVCPVLALGFAFDGAASPGTWIEAFNEIVFVGVGLGVLFGGREALRAGAAIGLGLVSLAVGLLDSAVFVHPVVLSLLPGALTRLLVVIAAGSGLAAIGLGGVGYADLLPAGLET